jgi:hypothetical protein
LSWSNKSAGIIVGYYLAIAPIVRGTKTRQYLVTLELGKLFGVTGDAVIFFFQEKSFYLD